MRISLEQTNQILENLRNGFCLKNASSDEISAVFSAVLSRNAQLIDERITSSLNDKAYFHQGISLDEACNVMFNDVFLTVLVRRKIFIDKDIYQSESDWLGTASKAITSGYIADMTFYIVGRGNQATEKDLVEFYRKLDLPKFEAETKLTFSELLDSLRNRVESHISPSNSLST